MREKKIVPELKKELRGDWYLYECEHVTDETYMVQGVLPVGRSANILVCKHCWQNLQAMFLAECFRDMLADNPGPELKGMVQRLLAQMADVPRLKKGDPRTLQVAEDD
jgi:hypothetical protein